MTSNCCTFHRPKFTTTVPFMSDLDGRHTDEPLAVSVCGGGDIKMKDIFRGTVYGLLTGGPARSY